MPLCLVKSLWTLLIKSHHFLLLLARGSALFCYHQRFCSVGLYPHALVQRDRRHEGTEEATSDLLFLLLTAAVGLILYMLFIEHLTVCVHWRPHDGCNKSIIFPSQFPVCASVSAVWTESGCTLEEAKRRRRTRTRDCWPLQCLHCLRFEWKSPCQQPCLKKFRQKEAPSVSSNTVITTDVGREQSLLGFRVETTVHAKDERSINDSEKTKC